VEKVPSTVQYCFLRTRHGNTTVPYSTRRREKSIEAVMRMKKSSTSDYSRILGFNRHVFDSAADPSPACRNRHPHIHLGADQEILLPLRHKQMRTLSLRFGRSGDHLCKHHTHTHTRRARQRAINRKKSRISTSTSSRHNYCQQNTTQTPTSSRSFPFLFLFLFLFELSLTEQQQQQRQQQSSPNTNNPHSLNTSFP
jgi:hypothetical protein